MPKDERNKGVPETGLVAFPKVAIINDRETAQRVFEATRKLCELLFHRSEIVKRYKSATGIEKDLLQLLAHTFEIPPSDTPSHVAVSTEDILALAKRAREMQAELARLRATRR